MREERIKYFIRDIIYQDLSFKNFPFKFPLIISSLLFLVGVKIRMFLYKRGIIKRFRPPFKVISIGGVSLGGQGKTTAVLKIAGYFLNKGIRPKVIVRDKAWDEAEMIKSKLGVEVYMGKNKTSEAKKIKDRGLVIIDDGFQHLRLSRDIDIVVLGQEEILRRGFLLPAGPFRESLSSIKRADIILVNNVPFFQKEDILKRLGRFVEIGKVFFSHYSIPYFLGAKGERYPPDIIKNKSLGLFSGIGNPQEFKKTIERFTPHILWERIFPDHYRFKERDLERIKDMAIKDEIDYLVTTSKDFSKISSWPYKIKLLIPEIEMCIVEEENFFKKIDEILGF